MRLSRINPMANPSKQSMHKATPTAQLNGLKTCLNCYALLPEQQVTCHICHATSTQRIPDSLSKTVAYLITAMLLFIPANILPIMSTSSIIQNQQDTILSGILHLWQGKAYFIAIIVLVASFITPLFKMISIGYLCYTCYRRSSKHLLFRTKLYHFNELIGRWSMIDVFVVALLGALVQMGAIANVEPRIGIVAFALVVFLTIFSMKHFDPRLIWDYSNSSSDSKITHHDPSN